MLRLTVGIGIAVATNDFEHALHNPTPDRDIPYVRSHRRGNASPSGRHGYLALHGGEHRDAPPQPYFRLSHQHALGSLEALSDTQPRRHR